MTWRHVLNGNTGKSDDYSIGHTKQAARIAEGWDMGCIRAAPEYTTVATRDAAARSHSMTRAAAPGEVLAGAPGLQMGLDVKGVPNIPQLGQALDSYTRTRTG